MFDKINNTQSKHIKKLHRKKNRQTFNEFIVEGTKTVLEYIQSDFECIGVYATEDWLLVNYNDIKHLKLFIVNSKQLSQISTFKNPQPVLSVFKIDDLDSSVSDNFILYLDDIRDPGNLGTIVRTAEWFGLKQIYCSATCADSYNTKVIQASMGSASRVSINYIEFENLISTNKEHIPVLADMNGVSLKKYEWKNKNILVVGNEANGVSEELKALVDNKLTIERIGKAESLNASISVAIVLSCFAMK